MAVLISRGTSSVGGLSWEAAGGVDLRPGPPGSQSLHRGLTRYMAQMGSAHRSAQAMSLKPPHCGGSRQNKQPGDWGGVRSFRCSAQLRGHGPWTASSNTECPLDMAASGPGGRGRQRPSCLFMTQPQRGHTNISAVFYWSQTNQDRRWDGPP